MQLNELIVKNTTLKDDHTVVFLWLNQMSSLHIKNTLCFEAMVMWTENTVYI